MVLLDELEKAGTRSDYGRLWDCLLAFLEPETSCRYPDPALQVSLDLSQISYIATANTLDPLPTPIRDRFRVVTFPKPGADDLDALLPAVMADLARERGSTTAGCRLSTAPNMPPLRKTGAAARCVACAASSMRSCVTATSTPRGTDHVPRKRQADADSVA